MRVDRPVGTYLLLFPCLMALFIAFNGIPPFKILIVFIIGTFLTRAAGCVINDIADRNIDSHVERTKNRPLATGEISVFGAIVCFVILLALAVCCLFFLPIQATYWAVVATILFCIYPFTKRFFKYPQIFLGFAFNMAIPMAFAVALINPFLSLSAWLLFLSNLCWIIAYDTNYAIKDLDDDKKLGYVNSTAIVWEENVNYYVLGFNTLYTLLLFALGYVNHFSVLYYVIIAINWIVLASQFFSVDALKPETGFAAFQQNITIGIVAFVAVLIGLLNQQSNQIMNLKSQVAKQHISHSKLLDECLNEPEMQSNANPDSPSKPNNEPEPTNN